MYSRCEGVPYGRCGGAMYNRCRGSRVRQVRGEPCTADVRGVMYSRCEANPDVRGVVHSRLRESCKEMWGSHVQHV